MPITSFGGLFWVPRWQETAGNMEKQGEKDKDIEKEKTNNTTKTATILWRFLLAIFDKKTGDFWDFGHFYARQSRLQPQGVALKIDPGYSIKILMLP